MTENHDTPPLHDRSRLSGWPDLVQQHPIAAVFLDLVMAASAWQARPQAA